MNSEKKIHVLVPEGLAKQVDKFVGKKRRSRFITEAVRKEVQRLNFLKAVRETAGAWKDKDHPELKGGTDRWVRKLREEDEKRAREIM